MTDKILWWGYRHVDGGLHAKRFFDAGDLDEARSSPFVAKVVGPFDCKTRDECLALVHLHCPVDGDA